MTFNSKKQSIPQVFLEKMAIDKKIEDMRMQEVVDFNEFVKSKHIQTAKRQGCAYFIARAKGAPPINGGSSGAGQVFVPENLEAIAA